MQICSVCSGGEHTFKVLCPANSKVSESKIHTYPLHGLHTSFMKVPDIFPVNSLWYRTVQRRTPRACLDRCSGDLCDQGCLKGPGPFKGSIVKETSAIQGQNEAVAQESNKEKRSLADKQPRAGYHHVVN